MRVPLPAPPRAMIAVATLCFGAVVVSPSAAQSQHASPAAAADSVSPAAIEAGRAVFHGAGTCFVCHGPNLEGGPMAPTLAGHAWKDAKGGSYSAILGVIMKGVPGTAMVSHPGGISDDDARRVAAYVWAVSQGKGKP